MLKLNSDVTCNKKLNSFKQDYQDTIYSLGLTDADAKNLIALTEKLNSSKDKQERAKITKSTTKKDLEKGQYLINRTRLMSAQLYD